jgi:hypothetical protein
VFIERHYKRLVEAEEEKESNEEALGEIASITQELDETEDDDTQDSE